MSTPLVPIAVSSEIDAFGNERIHAANYVRSVRATWAAPPAMLYAGLNTELALRRTSDLETFVTMANSGVIASSGNSVFSAGGRLYHWSFGNSTVVSTDAENFAITSGIASMAATPSALIKTSTEWQFYISNGLYPQFYSTNGVDFTLREFAGSVFVQPRVFGDNIVALASSGNTFGVSADEGVNFSTYTEAAFNSSNGLHRLLITADNHLVAFGRDASSRVVVGKSATGLSGSWSTSVITATATYVLRAAVSPAGRICILMANGTTWYSDDNADTWTQGATIAPISPYASNIVRTLPEDDMVFFDNKFVVAVEHGSGVNTLRISDGEESWATAYTTPAARNVNSMTSFLP